MGIKLFSPWGKLLQILGGSKSLSPTRGMDCHSALIRVWPVL